MKFFIKNFFSKCDLICRNLRIWPHLLEKPLMENFIFCLMQYMTNIFIIEKPVSWFVMKIIWLVSVWWDWDALMINAMKHWDTLSQQVKYNDTYVQFQKQKSCWWYWYRKRAAKIRLVMKGYQGRVIKHALPS